MPIKKSNFNPESWANQAPQAPETERGAGRKKAEKKISFATRIPESLYNELKKYIRTDADEKESINDIIVSGTRAELESRLKKHNLNIGIEMRKEAVIETLEKGIKELKTLY